MLIPYISMSYMIRVNVNKFTQRCTQHFDSVDFEKGGNLRCDISLEIREHVCRNCGQNKIEKQTKGQRFRNCAMLNLSVLFTSFSKKLEIVLFVRHTA